MKYYLLIISSLWLFIFSCTTDESDLRTGIKNGGNDSTANKLISKDSVLIKTAMDYIKEGEFDINQLFNYENPNESKDFYYNHVKYNFKARELFSSDPKLVGLAFVYKFVDTTSTEINIDSLAAVKEIFYRSGYYRFKLAPVDKIYTYKMLICLRHNNQLHGVKTIDFSIVGDNSVNIDLVVNEYDYSNEQNYINIPSGTTYSQFKGNVTAPQGASYELKNPSGVVYSDSELIIDKSQLLITDSHQNLSSYIVNVINAGKLIVNKYVHDHDAKTIEIPEGTQFSEFISNVFAPQGASYFVKASNNSIITSGDIPPGSTVELIADNTKTIYSINVVASTNPTPAPINLNITAYTHDHNAATITIPENTSVTDFVVNVTAPSNGIYVVLNASGTEISGATIIESGAKVKVTASDKATKEYIISIEAASPAIKMKTLNQIIADKSILLNEGTTIAEFKARVTNLDQIELKFFNSSDQEKGSGTLVSGDYVTSDGVKVLLEFTNTLRFFLPVGVTHKTTGNLSMTYTGFGDGITVKNVKESLTSLDINKTMKFYNSAGEEKTEDAHVVGNDGYIHLYSGNSWVRYDIISNP